MAVKKRRGQKTPNFSMTNPAVNNARAKKIESYEDTLEPGSTDEHIFRRDQIMFNPQDESDEDEDLGQDGEEVLSLNLPKRSRANLDLDEEEGDDEEMEEDEIPSKEMSKKEKKNAKSKSDLLTKGRFGKPIVSSDEEDDQDSQSGSGSGSGSEDDEEGWGRSYYSRPSSRKEKEDLRGEYDEKKEEEREMEIKEVKRLQRKAREGLAGDDWGLVEDTDELLVEPTVTIRQEPVKPTVTAPETSDPATLIRHLESYEPVKLALARDLPLVIRKIEKTARGIKAMMKEEEGQETLHKGLGWLHYQTLVTYATTLAFYLHLASLPPSTRPDLANHPIVPRLYELRKGVADLEELDFSAGSVSDGDPILESLKEEFGIDPNEELTPEKKLAFMDWLQKTREVNGGAGGMDDMEDEEEDEEDEEDFGDFDESWKGAGLEQDELDDLLADADDDLDLEPEIVEKAPKAKAAKSTKSKVTKTKPDSESTKKRSKKSKSKTFPSEAESAPTPIASFTPLVEPAFYSSKPKSKSSHSLSADDDTLGDATALLDADATDKERRTKTLRFHTSKIASTSNRRAAARAQRLGGDEDVPYRDRQKARDAALRKNSVGGQDGGEDLDGTEWTESDKKRAREVREEANEPDNGDGDADDGGAGEYYDLVKRRKVEKQAEKEAAHEERQAEKFASFEDESADGPRALTRAIEKNRGLTPRRNKTGRNPRVKKRQAYEKAKQKVGSQRAVYKGGQATVGGNYAGEKTGISTVVKSRKF